MSHRSDIDGLRALAVVPIVLFHFGAAILSGGYVGVDVFFVISGFVIARSIVADVDAGHFSLRAFYVRRICRIMPALVVTVVVTTAAAIWLLLPEDLIAHFRSVTAIGAFSSNIFFWRSSGYFEAAAQTRPLLHSWSLAVEEQFYFLAPPALAILHRRRPKWWLSAILVVAAGSLAVSIAMVFAAPTAGYFLLPGRAWELLLGAAVARASAAPTDSTFGRETIAAAGLAMVAGSMVMLDETSAFPGWNAIFPCVGTVLVILAGTGAGRPPLVNRLLATSPVRAIGRISYSLYLVHWPIVALFQYRLMRPPTLIEGAAMLVVSIALAVLSWRFVEEPMRRYAYRLRAVPAAQWRVIAVGAAVSAAMIGIGLAGAAAGGWPQRFPGYHPAAITGQEQWGGAACFNEDPSRPIPWDAERCTRAHGRGGRILLWGDSHAAHYMPGLIAEQTVLDRDVLQYTFAGCPPIFAYFSAARVGCSHSNARVPALIRRFGITQVVLAARWEEVPRRTLTQLHQTIATLQRLGVRVTVIGQSPMFGVTPQAFDYLSGQAARPIGKIVPRIEPGVTAAVRQEAAGAEYIDPLPSLCSNGLCLYRTGSTWLYADNGHLSAAGSQRAVRAFLIGDLRRR
ncbi:MAG: acyltransferase family protein [Sphingomonas phyllosphaerae]|uniref:acyltransferase family protein n=1 Tax=Sphingomonas phyllosphaerae TaxID=257003 RepID=UPI002FF48932